MYAHVQARVGSTSTTTQTPLTHRKDALPKISSKPSMYRSCAKRAQQRCQVLYVSEIRMSDVAMGHSPESEFVHAIDNQDFNAFSAKEHVDVTQGCNLQTNKSEGRQLHTLEKLSTSSKARKTLLAQRERRQERHVDFVEVGCLTLSLIAQRCCMNISSRDRNSWIRLRDKLG